MFKIVQKDNPILRGKAQEIPIEDIRGRKIQKVIGDMKKALEFQEDGVAIAAPQIGVPLRIFVISERIHALMEIKTDTHEDMVFINPKIIRLSKEKKMTDEGCLSVRYLYGKVKRSIKATIEAYDVQGNKFRKDGHGLLAQIFQHEIDHLEGVLFTDKANDIEEMLPPQAL
ncbi:MAG: peptide deformylase [Candidatus Pacebacteria bacterium]|nr:peptide deformylase [Candidatus Paceibacterota bacterium]